MGRNQSRIRNIVAATLFAIAVITFVQVTSARPAIVSDAVQDDDLRQRSDPDVNSCQFTINVLGNGAVDILQAGGEVERLSAEANEIQVDCDEVVEFTVLPDSTYRFVTWQGVPEELQHKHTIAISTPAEVTAVFAPRKIVRYESLQTPFVDRSGQLVTEVPIMESVWRTLPEADTTDTVAPVINVWYGQTQAFGERGTPQKWVNILGNVSDADGDLSKLEYKLNGVGPVALNVGGDGHRGDGLRLYRQGDFNVDIDNSLLVGGSNTVEIIATDSQQQTSRFVTIVYKTGNVWNLPYGINWSAASSIQNVTQIVDGKWSKTAAGVRPVELGFDRILAIGEMSTWSDFEMTVPVTVHGYSEEGFSPSQNRPAMGLVMRWKGHTTVPNLCDQPLCGYYPIGATAWYEFPSKISEDGQFSIWSKTYDKTLDSTGVSLNWGETYYWKVRSQSLEGTKGRYSMKIWPASGAEPDSWLITKDGLNDSYYEGSVLLLSHHVDVTFGNVSIVPFDATEGPPEIGGVKIIPEPKGATVRWFTDEPATGKVDFGETSAYGRSVSDGIGTSHSLYLPDLDPQMEYHFKITVKDSSNETASTEDDTFETQELIPLVSDDFNACTLDPAWEFINPLADGSYEMTGSHAKIFVPGGSNHDIYPPGPPLNRAPHLMRPVTDPNKIKVKFDSGVDLAIEQQGILVEQDDKNFLRINYQYKNGHLQLVVVGFNGGKPEHIMDVNLNGAAPDGPLYLLLTRQQGQWQLAYSTDDEKWFAAGTFSFPLSVTKAGFYAGNASKTPGLEPTFTAAVDYFFNADAPIVPEDGNPLALPVTIVGNGSVSKEPACGNPVTLTAEADPGWKFVEWQGSPIDGRIDLEITTPFEYGDEVNAVFAEGAPEMFSLEWQVDGQGTVILDPDKVEFVRGEVVELTADPADGWQFDSWGGDLSGTEPVQTIVMDDDKNVSAKFIYTEFNIVVTVVGPGHVQISPQGPYDYGEEVTLTAVPNVGTMASFIGWSGDIESTDNPLIVEMTDDLDLTATFIIYQQFMPVTMSPLGS